MSDLDTLPGNKDSYWKEADIQTYHLPPDKKCDHYFIRRNGREIKCRYCPTGYLLDPLLRLEKGKIYFEKQIVV